MQESKPYFMSAGTLAEMAKPFQVQTYVTKESNEAPVCQDFATYGNAATRICELLKAPMCPMTGKNLARIKLVKKAEPETFIDADINKTDEIVMAGIGIQESEAAETVGVKLE